MNYFIMTAAGGFSDISIYGDESSVKNGKNYLAPMIEIPGGYRKEPLSDWEKKHYLIPEGMMFLNPHEWIWSNIFTWEVGDEFDDNGYSDDICIIRKDTELTPAGSDTPFCRECGADMIWRISCYDGKRKFRLECGNCGASSGIRDSKEETVRKYTGS